MNLKRTSLSFIRILLDILVIVLSFILAKINDPQSTADFVGREIVLLTLLIFVWLLSSQATELYDEYRSRNFPFEAAILLKNVVFQFLAVIILIFMLKEVELSRRFVFMYTIILAPTLLLQKYLFRKYLIKLRIKGKNIRNVLIVGAGVVGLRYFELIKTTPHYGYRVVGFLDDDQKELPNGLYLGEIEKLTKVINEFGVERVIIALPNSAAHLIDEVVRKCEQNTVRVYIIPDYFKAISTKYNISMFGPFPIIAVREEKINEFHWRLLKRAFDTGFSLILFITLFWWLWPIIGLAIKIDSRGPVFYKQVRWGRSNVKFSAYKFRSMKCCDEENPDQFKQASKDDPRVTAIGRFLRKTNLDELPQFINILKGEMSVVGPRPHPEALNIDNKDNIQLYMIRHLVKPGLTGWAQVNGYRGETKETVLMEKRVEHDIWYIENWTPMLDFQIILTTVWNMLKGDPNAY